MKDTEFAKLVGEECDTRYGIQPLKPSARLALRIASAAAALLILVGVGFLLRGKLFPSSENNEAAAAYPAATVKLDHLPSGNNEAAAAYPEGFGFMGDKTIPEDAVLPPETNGESAADTQYACFFTFASAYEEADMVCIATITDWLDENDFCTCYSADVNRIYKGEQTDTVTVYQWGSSKRPNRVAQYTYGDKLLLFLHENPAFGENVYEIVGVDIGSLYLAADREGSVYFLDLGSLLSEETGNKNEALPETASITRDLRNDLFAYYGNRKELEWYFMHCRYIFTAESVDALLRGLGK